MSIIYIMVQTNIEYFNYNLRRFVLDIIKIFPDLAEDLNEYYAIVLENESCNEDKFIKRYMRKLGDYKELISQKNNVLFNESLHILKSVDFKELMERKEVTDTIRDSIWDYIQTLFVIGETIVSDSNSIKKLVENFKKIREADGDMAALEKGSSEVPEEVNADEQVMEMLKNLSDKTKEVQNNTPEINEEMINNGLIGNLAKELAEDINLDDFNLNINESSENVNDVFSNLISGDNPMKFMNLIQNVGQKIQTKLSDGNIDQSKLVDEAQQMMGMLGNNNPLFENLLGKAKQEVAPQSRQDTSNPTRDRLRKKLEQKKKAKK
jgi:hypothetical protein